VCYSNFNQRNMFVIMRTTKSIPSPLTTYLQSHTILELTATISTEPTGRPLDSPSYVLRPNKSPSPMVNLAWPNMSLVLV
jgi:hypothetical protein